MKRSYKKVIFDLDGTLVDSAPSLCFAGNKVLAKLDRSPVTVDEYKNFIGKGIAKQVEQLLIFTGGIPDGDLGPFLKLFRVFYDSDPLIATTVYPGVLVALKELKDMGFRLSLCTQKAEIPAKKVLDGLKLKKFFDGLAFGDSLDVLKPNPKMVEFSVRELGPGPSIYVGDSEIDSETASNAGIPFFLFSKGYRKTPVNDMNYEVSFENYMDLPGYISNWFFGKKE